MQEAGCGCDPTVKIAGLSSYIAEALAAKIAIEAQRMASPVRGLHVQLYCWSVAKENEAADGGSLGVTK